MISTDFHEICIDKVKNKTHTNKLSENPEWEITRENKKAEIVDGVTAAIAKA